MQRPAKDPSTQELIERYQRELMAVYRQHTPTPSFDEQFPTPDLQRDLAVAADMTQPPVGETPSTEPLPPVEGTPPAEEAPPHVGYLQVFAFAGREAQPIEGARVIVTRPTGSTELLYANTETDRSGLTPVIPLPSVDPALTLDPTNTVKPYVTYNIQVSALGYTPVLYENVPVYGGNGVTQPAALTPLVAGDNGDVRRVYRSDGPVNLEP